METTDFIDIMSCRQLPTIRNRYPSLEELLGALVGGGDTAQFDIKQVLAISGGNNARGLKIELGPDNDKYEFEERQNQLKLTVDTITKFLDSSINENVVKAGLIHLICSGLAYRYLSDFTFNEDVSYVDYIEAYLRKDVVQDSQLSKPSQSVINQKVVAFNEFHKMLNTKLQEYFNVKLLKGVEDAFDEFFNLLESSIAISAADLEDLKRKRDSLLTAHNNIVKNKFESLKSGAPIEVQDRLQKAFIDLRKKSTKAMYPDIYQMRDHFDMAKTTYDENFIKFRSYMSIILPETYFMIWGAV